MVSTAKTSSEASNDDHDVLVYPVIQAGLFNVREEERCLSLLFHELAVQQRYSVEPVSGYEGPLVDLTSGYFALYKPYQSAMITSGIASRILAASPLVGIFSSAEMSSTDCLRWSPSGKRVLWVKRCFG